MLIPAVAAADDESAAVPGGPVKVLARGTSPAFDKVEVRSVEIDGGWQLHLAVRDQHKVWWRSAQPDDVYQYDNGMCKSARSRISRATVTPRGTDTVVARIDVKVDLYMVCADRLRPGHDHLDSWSEIHVLTCRAAPDGVKCAAPVITSTRK